MLSIIINLIDYWKYRRETKCKVKVRGIYLRSELEYDKKGREVYAPVFQYSYEGRDYVAKTFQQFSWEFTDRHFEHGEEYNIYLQKGNPKRFILKEKSTKQKVFRGIMIAILVLFLNWIIMGVISVGAIFLSFQSAEVEVNTDIDKYQDYLGENALEDYKHKLGMDESIFPDKITDDMDVEDYKMVYYNPWDAQYLSYLVVDYDEAGFAKEVERLKKYDSTEYIGYYGVTGFAKEYELLAMYADSYQGFVYALSDREDTIIYVELIFCNYFFDLDYEEYIEESYLPIGFDATSDNPYRTQKLGKW